MIKVTIFYPNIEGKRFDLTYYCNKHMPMVQQTMAAACKGMAVEAGLSGITPGSRAAYIAMGHLYFDSVEAFQAAFGPNAQKFMGDVPNYTDIEGSIQISDVKM
jgi:uncharacterized protein (TIGR02118 family)